MSMAEYLRGQWELVVGETGALVLINVILLTSTPLAQTLGEILYLDLLAVLLSASGLFFHFRRLRRAYAEIRRCMSSDHDGDALFLTPKGLSGNNAPGVSLMKELVDYKNARFSAIEENYQRRMNDQKDYLNLAVHDMKGNLAVCEMAANRLENEPDIANKLLFQIEQMKFRVDQTLSIARANHYSEDIAAETIDLAQAVKEAIGSNTEFFIAKGISISTDLKPYRFVSDRKWVLYIITQILNNSSKYTGKNGEITIYGRENEDGYRLCLRDNGIGIPAEELGRIFDKGFTGSNGRMNTHSTGMGMYYAKKMANALGIGLEVRSERGVYTEFTLFFYKLSDYMRRQQY